MAERSNAAVLKTVDSKGPGVRIPLSPQPTEQLPPKGAIFFLCSVTSLLVKAEHKENCIGAKRRQLFSWLKTPHLGINAVNPLFVGFAPLVHKSKRNKKKIVTALCAGN